MLVSAALSKLVRADAGYKCVKSKSECIESTRVQIRESIVAHLRKRENRFVWLHGSPGTGKTAISMSVASTLDTQGFLAASFFWDKNQPQSGLDSLYRFPSTLACQLAAFSAYHRITLFKHLRQPSLDGVQGFTLERQMKALILDPMHEMREWLSLSEDRWVIILDGLDEWGNPEELEKLMRIVIMLDGLHPKFTVLISCRPERQLHAAWAKFGDVPC